jgi:hypothetical protein
MAVALLVVVGCSTDASRTPSRSRLDHAIARYIAGDYSAAESELLDLTAHLKSNEDLQTAYLYLGRTYLAIEDYIKAADAFSTGRMLGGGVQFDAYMEMLQGELEANAKSIRLRPRITRGQLAALLAARLPVAPRRRDVAPPPDVARHWSKDYAETALGNGWMKALPDGRFHPDAPVTRVAFFLVLRRAATASGISDAVLQGVFPGGYRGALEAGAGKDGTEDGFVSGNEAVADIEALFSASGS